jgi:carnitine O-palmitoyltransferase 1
LRRGVNRTSLTTIETAAFVVALDDYDYEVDNIDNASLTSIGKIMLHGRGNDRWFDKSFSIIVGKNGRMGMNVEHAW